MAYFEDICIDIRVLVHQTFFDILTGIAGEKRLELAVFYHNDRRFLVAIAGSTTIC